MLPIDFFFGCRLNLGVRTVQIFSSCFIRSLLHMVFGFEEFENGKPAKPVKLLWVGKSIDFFTSDKIYQNRFLENNDILQSLIESF